MKTIGLIGGMSWESTVTYYQVINEAVKERLGGFHSAKILMYSVDFDDIEKCLEAEDWQRGADMLADIASRLERAGADFILICTNTLHKVAPQVQSRIGVPLIHIADATADALISAGIKKVGLLGTKYTMTQDFITERLCGKGLEVVLPESADMDMINGVIFNELCLGVVSDESRKAYGRVIDGLKAKGAEGVILGCTEIGMLIAQKDSSLPIFDTTLIHARAAAEAALN